MSRALALLLVMASPVSAQIPTAHTVGLSVYAVGASLDLHSTHRALSHGHRELNPLGRLTEGSPTGTVVAGAAADVAVTTLLYKWLGKTHPRLTTALVYTAAGVRVGLAARNYRNVSNAGR